MGWGYGQSMWWMWLWGPLLLIGIVLLVLLAVRVSRGGLRRDDGPGAPGGLPPTGTGRARQILDERFAKGELTADQYHENRRVLGEGP